jgi:hypothetical protein
MMKRYIYALVALLAFVSTPTHTQDRPSLVTNNFANCRYWNAVDKNLPNGSGRLSYIYGFYEGVAAGSLTATTSVERAYQIQDANRVERAYQVQDVLLPKKLNRGELIGRLDTYCADDKHQEDTLIGAIKHIADDFNNP